VSEFLCLHMFGNNWGLCVDDCSLRTGMTRSTFLTLRTRSLR
jgi:hypothetical protein